MHIVKDYMDNELTLLTNFRNGDEAAFTAIYDQFYFIIYQYAKRWVANKQAAEDIASESFVKLWQRREQMESMENVVAFLKVAARNACINSLKHEKIKTNKHAELLQQLSSESEPDFAWLEIKEEFLQLIYSEVENMPKKMREVFLLAFRDGLKPSEIAERLELNVQTVSNHKTNAIKLLKTALAKKPLWLGILLFLTNN